MDTAGVERSWLENRWRQGYPALGLDSGLYFLSPPPQDAIAGQIVQVCLQGGAGGVGDSCDTHLEKAPHHPGKEPREPQTKLSPEPGPQ